jgi:uncharacterized phage-like protein YoqJ
MIAAATGHRPDKLRGYDTHARLTDLGIAVLFKYKPEKVISGFALGWDLAVADAAIQLEIPLIAAIPFPSQPSTWPKSSQLFYQQLLEKASQIEIISPDPYSALKMRMRNEWMINNCDFVIALWDGSAGGTGNCMNYIIQENKPYKNFWKSWQKYGAKCEL